MAEIVMMNHARIASQSRHVAMLTGIVIDRLILVPKRSIATGTAILQQISVARFVLWLSVLIDSILIIPICQTDDHKLCYTDRSAANWRLFST